MLVPVYDILNCGPRHRFVANGKLVHNSDKVNFQNLPSRDKKKKALKNAVIAPNGYKIINCDSSQIEARVLAWLAGQDDVLELFISGKDAYKAFASRVYKKSAEEVTPIERFVGKTCIAEGTLVLCESGWKPIEMVSITDRIWDGDNWVCHQGLLKNGLKETLSLCGSWLTPDHRVWSGTKWLEAQSIKQESSILFQALGFAAENLPSQGMYEEKEGVSKVLSLNAIADWMNTQWTLITSKLLKALDVIYAPKERQMKNAIGLMLKPFQMMPIELGFLTDSQRQSPAVTQRLLRTMSTTDKEVYTSTKGGARIKQNSSDMLKRWMGGITQNIKWTVSIITKAMSRAIFGLSHRVTMLRTKEKSLSLKPVYDILNSGSQNRFTILTDKGPLIVHNCVLGLGYGTGAAKLQHTLKTTPPGVVLEDSECKNLVSLYREVNDKIIQLWSDCDDALDKLANWQEDTVPFYIGKHQVLLVTKDGIRLPNGLYIRYPELMWDTSESKSKFTYKSRKGKVSIWGGSVVENVVQALARIIVGEQMLKVAEKYRVALTVHDSVVAVVPVQEEAEAIEYITQMMSTPPDWAKGLPVTCEAGFGESYGDC